MSFKEYPPECAVPVSGTSTQSLGVQPKPLVKILLGRLCSYQVRTKSELFKMHFIKKKNKHIFTYTILFIKVPLCKLRNYLQPRVD
jgi:hypothetical protein